MKTILASITFLAPLAFHAQAAPANDSFTNRTVLPSQAALPFNGTTVNATAEFGDPDSNFVSVWYEWTPAKSGGVSVSLASGLGLRASVHVGNDLLTGKYLANDPNISRGIPLRFYAIAGQAYHLCFWSFGGSYASNFTAGLVNNESVSPSTQFVFPLSNDDFARAYQAVGTNPRFVQYTLNATFEPFEAELQSRVGITNWGVGGVWVKWKAPATGKASFVAHSVSLADVSVVAGRGNSIESLSIKATGRNIATFRCFRGITYHLYLVSPFDPQVLARIKVR